MLCCVLSRRDRARLDLTQKDRIVQLSKHALDSSRPWSERVCNHMWGDSPFRNDRGNRSNVCVGVPVAELLLVLGRVPLITDNEIKASHLFRVKSTNLATQEESKLGAAAGCRRWQMACWSWSFPARTMSCLLWNVNLWWCIRETWAGSLMSKRWFFEVCSNRSKPIDLEEPTDLVSGEDSKDYVMSAKTWKHFFCEKWIEQNLCDTIVRVNWCNCFLF